MIVFKLFWTFFKIGLFTFGGGYAILPILQGELVDKRGWTTSEKLADMYAVAQCQPGPIAINVSVLIASGYKGRAAGVFAGIGVGVPSFIIILLIAVLLENFRDIPQVQQALSGIKIAVAALVISIAWRMIKNGVKDIPGALIFAAATALLIFDVVSAVVIILCGGALGIIITLLRQKKKEGKA